MESERLNMELAAATVAVVVSLVCLRLARAANRSADRAEQAVEELESLYTEWRERLFPRVDTRTAGDIPGFTTWDKMDRMQAEAEPDDKP